jgi:hypothetical protein
MNYLISKNLRKLELRANEKCGRWKYFKNENCETETAKNVQPKVQPMDAHNSQNLQNIRFHRFFLSHIESEIF